MKIKVGDSVTVTKIIKGNDVEQFAEVSGDCNPLHINKEVAEASRFKGRICHGMLVGSYISAVIANQLPGPGSIYLEQSLKFVAPVYWNDTVHIRVEVIDIKKEKIVTLLTSVHNQDGKEVATGNAVILYED